MTSGVICQYRDKSFRVRVRYEYGGYAVEAYNPRRRVYEVEMSMTLCTAAKKLFSDMVREYLACL